MRTDVKRRGWTISAEGNDLADRFLESVFFTGKSAGRWTPDFSWLAFMTGSPTAQS